MHQDRRPIVAGNWKMNGSLCLASDIQLAISQHELDNLDVVICPPFPYFSAIDTHQVYLGAQNVSAEAPGAHTGEISTDNLQEFNCSYVIVGHSERRQMHNESDTLIAEKVAAVLAADLTPILCVGESESQRDSGSYLEFLAAQLDAVINKVGVQQFRKLVIAYEPIWAIGTGKTATPEQAQDVHQFIRQHIAAQDTIVAQGLRILYGGSVKGANATELFAQQDVDGGLIGGASLDAQDFVKICQAANQ